MKSTMMFLAVLEYVPALYGQNPLSTELKQRYSSSKGDITKAAERMPDADYSFKPAEGNTRTYGQIIGHIADTQILLCSAAKGEQKRGDAEGTKVSKADLVTALKESFDYCDNAYDSLTDTTAIQMVKMFGRDQTELGTLYFNVIHNSEMYGQIVTYFRAKGMVPPSTADRPNMGKKK
jgi:DinB superfamily